MAVISPGWVSIHVPLAEHDGQSDGRAGRGVRFNSRAPRGARLPCVTRGLAALGFNSRAPRGARQILLSRL